MKSTSLRTRFIITGCLLLAFTIVCGVWSVITFRRLGNALGRTLHENQETINVAVDIIYALEREDDELLLALNNGVKDAAEKLQTNRQNFERAYKNLQPHVRSGADEQAYKALRVDADAYRKAGDSLIALAGQPIAFRRYSREVNPLLRQAVADARHFRESNVEAMQAEGVETEADSKRSGQVVAGITLAAFVLSAGVVVLLTRKVMRPIAELDRAVDALRHDKLDYRVNVRSNDELGRLAAGFNRLAEELQASRGEIEERFRQMAENIHEIFWVRNVEDERFLYISPGYEEIWGRSRDSLYKQPRSWIEHVHPDDKDRALEHIEQQNRGIFNDAEFRIIRPDGLIRWIRSRAFPTKALSGNISRVAGLAEDITDRKRADEALRESEQRWRSLTEALPQLVWSALPDGACDYFSKQWTEHTGVAEPDLLGWRWLETLHPDDREPTRRFWLESVAGHHSYDIEYRVRRRDGEYRWFKTRGTPIWDTGGKISKWFGTCTDITDLRHAEDALRHLASLLRLSYDAIMVWRPDGSGIESWSRGAEEIYGYSEAEALGRVTHELLQSAFPVPWPQIEAQLRSSGRWEGEIRHRTKDGREVIVSSRLQLVDDADGNSRILETNRDVTDQKHAEEALREAKEAAEAANRAKDEFLANVSHEIRTPMNAILGMTELALDTPLTTDQRQYLTTVKSAAENLLTIINDLLDFSKIEAGKLELDAADFSLRGAVGETLRALAVRSHKKGLELIYEVDSNVPDCLVGDLGRLRQVLLNLVGNAIKFTNEGEVVVRVEAADEAGPASRAGPEKATPSEAPLESPHRQDAIGLRFVVRDTGVGIPRDRQQAIFRAFEQEDSSTTRKFGGTGLGLTIASKIVELMGGRISVESVPGKGSTFTFTASFGFHPHPAETDACQPPVLLRGLRVLVVDDNATNRHILEEWLRSWQMDASAVSDGVAALDALWEAATSKRPFELVMLDARMPDTDGLAIAELIRKRQDLAATRLILLTSGDRPGDIAQYRQLRINAHLLKPVQQDELLETIYRVMSGKNGDSPSVTASSARQNGANGELPPLRVLVAEDNEFNGQLLELLLTRQGHEVQIARNGVYALALLDETDFDLLLLDIHMPEMDGFQVVQKIRERESGTGRRLPVIALTARSRKEDRESCLAAGMDDFLVKPLRPADLNAAIGRLLVSDSPEKSGQSPPVETGQTVLDAKILLSICGADQHVLDKIREAFQSHLPLQLTAIRDLSRASDGPRLREAAHKLSGMVAAFSTVVGSVTASLEDLAAANRLDECRPVVEKLEKLSADLLEQLDGLSIEKLQKQAADADG